MPALVSLPVSWIPCFVSSRQCHRQSPVGLVLPLWVKQKPLASLHRQNVGVLRSCSQACVRHTQPSISAAVGLWLPLTISLLRQCPLPTTSCRRRLRAGEYAEGEAMWEEAREPVGVGRGRWVGLYLLSILRDLDASLPFTLIPGNPNTCGMRNFSLRKEGWDLLVTLLGDCEGTCYMMH